MQPTEVKYLTVGQAAKFVGCTTQAVRIRARDPLKLKSSTVFGVRVVLLADLETWKKERDERARERAEFA